MLNGGLINVSLNPISRQVSRQLREIGLTLALAESCTGGLLADTITAIPGSSAYFIGGVVAYHPQVKVDLLQVDSHLLNEPGVVSAAVAEAMAAGARRLFQADLGLGITGVAGPGGGSPRTPVGRVFIAVARGGGGECQQFDFSGSRAEIKRYSVRAALKMLGGVLGAG